MNFHVKSFAEFLLMREGILPYKIQNKNREEISWSFKTRNGQNYEVTAQSLRLQNGKEIAKVDYHALDEYGDIYYAHSRVHHDDWRDAADVLDTVSKIIKDIKQKANPAGFLFESIDPVRAKLVDRWTDQEFPGWKKQKTGSALAIFKQEEDLVNYRSYGFEDSIPYDPPPRRYRPNFFAPVGQS